MTTSDPGSVLDRPAPAAGGHDAEGSRPRRPWYRRPRRVVALVALLALALGGVLFARSWSERGAEEASTEDAIQRYREQEGAGDGASGFLRPAAGVYEYEASGTERLSLLETTQRWGPTMPATVRHEPDGCWVLRIEYSTNHWQELTACPTETELLEDGGRTFQSFDFVAFTVGDTNVFTCEPRGVMIRIDAQPGDRWSQSCDGRSEQRGTKVTSAGPNTFLGVEELDIGGTTVGALHYRSERTLSGDQTGGETTHSWYSVTDGMLLRSTHDVRVASPSPIGDVVYTERGEFQLTSRTPQR